MNWKRKGSDLMNYDNLHAIICRYKDDLEKISGKLVTNASNLSIIVVPTKEELMELKYKL